jgi:bud site selection protein 20
MDQIHEDLKDGGKKKFLDDLTRKDIEDLPGAL